MLALFRCHTSNLELVLITKAVRCYVLLESCCSVSVPSWCALRAALQLLFTGRKIRWLRGERGVPSTCTFQLGLSALKVGVESVFFLIGIAVAEQGQPLFTPLAVVGF